MTRIPHRPSTTSIPAAPATPEVPRAVTRHNEGSLLMLKVAPRSRNPGVDGMLGGSLKLRLAAPPVDNKANAEVVDVLAKMFDLPRSRVKVLFGQTSTLKKVLLEGLDPDRAQMIVDEALKRAGASRSGRPGEEC